MDVVLSGADVEGKHRGLGISTIAFKSLPTVDHDILIIENSFHAPGGPAKHLHFDQDEFFYALEGSFVIEVGECRYHMEAGDSLMAPRRVPHVWASVGSGVGRMLISFTPAGLMESFFRTVTLENAMPPSDPELWLAHGMELKGPPLSLD